MKVISFSLWGDNPDYLIGAKRNAELARDIYPGWETWFYVEKGTNINLENLATRVIYYDSELGSDGMFQRFRPMQDPLVDVFISRDCDSRLSDREYQAVQEWLVSDKQFHCMRDHEHHGIPVLGGMWGAKKFGLLNLDFIFKLLCNYKNKNYFDDQKGLTNLYNISPTLFMEHDDFPRFNSKPFPKHLPMIYGSFVGQRITYEDKEGKI